LFPRLLVSHLLLVFHLIRRFYFFFVAFSSPRLLAIPGTQSRKVSDWRLPRAIPFFFINLYSISSVVFPSPPPPSFLPGSAFVHGALTAEVRHRCRRPPNQAPVPNNRPRRGKPVGFLFRRMAASFSGRLCVPAAICSFTGHGLSWPESPRPSVECGRPPTSRPHRHPLPPPLLTDLSISYRQSGSSLSIFLSLIHPLSTFTPSPLYLYLPLPSPPSLFFLTL
jgi:hypothetical protein